MALQPRDLHSGESLEEHNPDSPSHCSGSPETDGLGTDDPPTGNQDKGHTRCTLNDLSLISFICFSKAQCIQRLIHSRSSIKKLLARIKSPGKARPPVTENCLT